MFLSRLLGTSYKAFVKIITMFQAFRMCCRICCRIYLQCRYNWAKGAVWHRGKRYVQQNNLKKSLLFKVQLMEVFACRQHHRYVKQLPYWDGLLYWSSLPSIRKTASILRWCSLLVFFTIDSRYVKQLPYWDGVLYWSSLPSIRKTASILRCVLYWSSLPSIRKTASILRWSSLLDVGSWEVARKNAYKRRANVHHLMQL